MRPGSVLMLVALLTAGAVAPVQGPVPDVIVTTSGDLSILPIAHASLAISYRSEVILIDPARFGPGQPPPPPSEDEVAQARNALRVASPDREPQPATLVSAFFVRPGQLDRFNALPSPTLILVTDIHTDHLDPRAIAALRSPATRLVVPTAARLRLLDVQGAELMANGETRVIGDVTIEAVPMYNPRPDREFGAIFHTRGRGNGYILTVAGKRLYVAGDTACTPEMMGLTNIDVAFLPMNLPYTMSPVEAAECARAFRPAIVYPYHYFESDPGLFEEALKGSGIEVRLRDWYSGAPGRKD